MTTEISVQPINGQLVLGLKCGGVTVQLTLDAHEVWALEDSFRRLLRDDKYLAQALEEHREEQQRRVAELKAENARLSTRIKPVRKKA